MAAAGAAAVASEEEPAQSLLCVPGLRVAFPFFDVDDSGETRLFAGALLDHVPWNAPRLSQLLTEGLGDISVWAVAYDDGDAEAVLAEHVPAGIADHVRAFDAAQNNKELEGGEAGDGAFA